MKTITIGFSSPRSFKIGAEIIKLWQGGTSYSHAFIKIYSSYTDLTLIYQASHGYVNCLEVSRFFKENKIVAEFQIQVPDQNLRDTIREAQLLLQAPYGYKGLIILGVSRILETTLKKCKKYQWCATLLDKVSTWGDGLQTFHCSELVARLVPEIIQYTQEKDPDRIEPVDLYKVLDSGVIGKRVECAHI